MLKGAIPSDTASYSVENGRRARAGMGGGWLEVGTFSMFSEIGAMGAIEAVDAADPSDRFGEVVWRSNSVGNVMGVLLRLKGDDLREISIAASNGRDGSAPVGGGTGACRGGNGEVDREVGGMGGRGKPPRSSSKRSIRPSRLAVDLLCRSLGRSIPRAEKLCFLLCSAQKVEADVELIEVIEVIWLATG